MNDEIPYEIDMTTGEFIVYDPTSIVGGVFDVNYETGELEVTIND